jgi:exopolysaccharide biosynthesis protein
MSRSRISTAFCLLALPFAAWADALPYSVERFSLPGPIAGVLVRLDIGDPRVAVTVALADAHDPDGPGPMTGRLDTPRHVARSHDFAITLNASYFKVADSGYFIGNGAAPVGWHFSGNKLISSPARDAMRATMVVHQSGAVTLAEDVRQLPADTRYAVSGSAMMLSNGVVNPPSGDVTRHPRSAVGITADGRTLLMMAVDGRQEGYSRGVSLGELGSMMLHYGALHAINLDGGGSTALVVKDMDSGSYSLLNRPSDRGGADASAMIERPVADVIGIRIAP